MADSNAYQLTALCFAKDAACAPCVYMSSWTWSVLRGRESEPTLTLVGMFNALKGISNTTDGDLTMDEMFARRSCIFRYFFDLWLLWRYSCLNRWHQGSAISRQQLDTLSTSRLIWCYVTPRTPATHGLLAFFWIVVPAFSGPRKQSSCSSIPPKAPKVDPLGGFGLSSTQATSSAAW